MRTHSQTTRIRTTGLLVLAGSLAALVAARPSGATTFVEVPYTMPAVFAFATAGPPNYATRSRGDVSAVGDPIDAPRRAGISNGTVSGVASAALNAFSATAFCAGPGIG